jgi:quercetin dioxygenase-like cupin family protein
LKFSRAIRKGAGAHGIHARPSWARRTDELKPGQVVTAGVGSVQEWGKAAQDIRPRDIVWIPPGVKLHWHGAKPTVAMTHIAIAESVDGSPVTWLEQVSEEQYRTAP